jgi:hypothetical protein
LTEDLIKMLIEAAQTMSFSGASSQEDTVTLTSPKLYSGIRVSFETTAGTAANILDGIEALTMTVPEYGANAKRVDVDGDTAYLLPLMAALGGRGAADGVSRSGTVISTGADKITGFTYFDLPVNKKVLNTDTRITIRMTAGATETVKVSFAFIDSPMQPVYFASYYYDSEAATKQFFPADGVLSGVAVLCNADGTNPTSGTIARGRDDSDITQVTLDGNIDTTFNEPILLGGGLDECISGGDQGEFFALDSFAMLKNFPRSNKQRFVNVTGSAASSRLILGVMSDA